MTLHAVTLMISSRLSDDVDRYIDHVGLRVVPPPCPVTVGAGDFSHADELIEGSYHSTVDWLGCDRDLLAANPLAVHHAITRNVPQKLR
jgi:NTE family protein